MRPVSLPPSEPAPARVGALSVLPVFLDLRGMPALVAGGSAAAAWKAELLAAAGARVTVAAAALGEEMTALAARGTVLHHPGPWTPALLDGAAVAVADLEEEDEARAFAAAARAAAVPCNVIDKPAFCAFQFGSIVNRSPVVVGISTTGAAPILGQAVRQRIEALLPPALARWGELARRLRAEVSRLAAPARRRVWEGLAARAFDLDPGPSEADALRDLMADAPQGGRVVFVGAGPGDPAMLTLAAIRALNAAEVILFDDLVSDEVLELARREARRILVGKRAGRPSCRQEEIIDMMLSLARAGRRVVRLKSGDPMIFGRMGEEAEALAAEGIPYEVIPGITAAQALGARLGLSLTHRDGAKSLRLVTGHSKAGGLPEGLDWEALADPTATTIVYMGGRTAAALAARLRSLGLPADLPAVVAAALARPAEAIVPTTLGEVASAVAVTPKGEPLLIGLGSVFGEVNVGTDRIRRIGGSSCRAEVRHSSLP